MILILPNIKNSKLMNFRSLKPLSNSTLAAMEFAKKFKDDFKFTITQVIGLTNDDEVSKEFRPYKQMIERLNRTYKASYRTTNGFDNYEGCQSLSGTQQS